MTLADVNVLVAAFRQDHVHHLVSADWLDRQVFSPTAYGVSDRVIEGFIRIVTHPTTFDKPDPLDHAVDFVDSLLLRDNCVRVNPGRRQWDLFLDLVQETGAVGNAVSDAWLAALAIESGSEWVTWDRGFARYPGLKWSTPSLPS